MAICQWCSHTDTRPADATCTSCGEPPSKRKLARIAKRRRRGTELKPKEKRRAHYVLELRDGKGCFYCGSDAPLAIDHAIPKSAGGTNAQWNLRRACRPCNRAKGSKSEAEFLAQVIARVGSAADRRANPLDGRNERRARAGQPVVR